MNALLVYDVDGWAWHNKAIAIKKYMPKQYFENVRIMNISRFKKSAREEISKANAIHIFGFKQGSRWASKCSTTIASHYSFANARKENARLLNRYRAIAAVNQELYDDLKKYAGGLVWCVPNGVDTEIYNSQGRKDNNKLVVGWVGKPMWDIGWKRVTNYLEYMGMGGMWPELKKRISAIPNVEVREVAHLSGTALSTEEMVNFYRGIDIFICTHYKCGTPNPAFEAAACGCCVITTPCGDFKGVVTRNGAISVPGYYGKDDNEKVDNVMSMICDRIKSIDRNVVRYYYDHGEEIINQGWTWKKRVIPFVEMMIKSRYK